MALRFQEVGYGNWARLFRKTLLHSPSWGRWITSDPGGFVDGPNLYAYAHNRPLTHTDLYGLASTNISSYGTTDWLTSYQWKEALRPSTYLPYNRFSYGNYSFGNYLLGTTDYRRLGANMYGVSGKSLSHHSLLYLPGINTTPSKAWAQANFISQAYGGMRVIIPYQGTNGLGQDLIKAGFLKLNSSCSYNNMGIEYIRQKLKEDPEHIFTAIAYSGGTLHMKNMENLLSEKEKKRIDSITFGPASFITKTSFASATNYVSKKDRVSMFAAPITHLKALIGINKKYNIKFLSASIDSDEHSLLGETYANQINDLGNKFQDIHTGDHYE